jgi:acyl-CoA synthetase (AMP-forming)/AMP-acid ligase II
VGGEQVSPPEVEAVLGQHPDVAAAVVFAVPSPTWGEEVGVAIVLHGSRGHANGGSGGSVEGGASCKVSNGKAVEDDAVTIADIRSFALTKLAARKVPAHWRIVADATLPKTGAGKYIRIGLAEKLGVSVQDFAFSSVNGEPHYLFWNPFCLFCLLLALNHGMAANC